jgi:KRAB domain-containing zinc finger protein
MHTRIHSNIVRVLCDHCDLSFTKKSSFIRHYISLHTDRKDFLCTHCPKAFSSMPTLRHHLFTHTEFKKEVCSICSGRFHTKTKLKRHMRTHASTKEYSCPICFKEFTQKYNVNAHLKTVHAESRQSKRQEFPCTICNISHFKTLTQLRKHLAQSHEVVNETEAMI